MRRSVGKVAFTATIAMALACQRPGVEHSEQTPQSQGRKASERELSAPEFREKSREAAPAARKATFGPGTSLVVRTIRTLSTKTVKSGERFVASLEEPLVRDGWVVAPKGAAVEGKVVDSDSGGRIKGVAALTVTLTELETSDGRRVPLATSSVARQAKKTVKREALRTAAASGVGAAIGAIAGGGKGAAIGAGAGAGAGTAVALATRGAPAVIPAETVLQFKLSAPLAITEKM